MKISQVGIELIISFEGFRNKAYLCPAKVLTIGYGTTRYPNGEAVKSGDICTTAQALQWKAHDIVRFENNVMKFHERYKWNQNEFDALVSFAYNIGSIDKLVANGTRTREQIAAAMPLYNKGGGVVLPGLVRRREAERNLFLKAVNNSSQNDLKAAESDQIPLNTFATEMRAALGLGVNMAAKDVLAATITVSRSNNSKHKTVMAIQNLLKSHNYYPGKIDGIFGNLSDTATRTYQKEIVGLKTPDGIWTGNEQKRAGASYKKSLGIVK